MHVPVLLKETIDCLGFTDKDKIFLDATVGAGGHSLEICKRFPWLQIIAIDADEEALSLAEENLKIGGCQFEVKIENFRNLAKTMDELGIQKVDKILFDIGMSSMHIDISGRGFSFQKDEPLLMTMKKELEGSLTAYEIVNSWPKDEIEKILRDYGEESFARKIAEQIVKERKKGPIKTTLDLVKVIEDATPKFYRHKRIHPATKTFQAIRIAVNDELESLKEGIGQAFERLRVGGRLAVISFHSLEDRIVKKNFKELEKNGKGKLITKKPLTASFEEIKINSRIDNTDLSYKKNF